MLTSDWSASAPPPSGSRTTSAAATAPGSGHQYIHLPLAESDTLSLLENFPPQLSLKHWISLDLENDYSLISDYSEYLKTSFVARFPPGKDWEVNTGLELALARLQPVKEEFGAALSWADLIVLAGTTALEAGMQVTRLDISTIYIMSNISRCIYNI